MIVYWMAFYGGLGLSLCEYKLICHRDGFTAWHIVLEVRCSCSIL